MFRSKLSKNDFRLRFPNAICGLLLLLWLAGSSISGSLQGQEKPWEFDAYRIRTWIHMGDHPALNDRLFQRVVTEATYDAESLDRSGWKLSFEQAPKEHVPRMDQGIGSFELTPEMKEHDDFALGDQLALVSIKFQDDLFHITTRQLNCTTQLFGPVSESSTPYPSCIPSLVYESLRATLVPIAKIERIEGEFVRLRVRATHIMKKLDESGVLVANTDSPGWISMDSILRPVIRRNNKDGRIAKKDGIRVVDWTFLRPDTLVRNTVVEDQYYIKAQIHGAKRAPLAGRTSRSQKKYALVVRPTRKTTTLQIITRDKKPKTIPDKKIYVRYPKQPKEKEAAVIGQTDKDGKIVIPSDENPLHLIYIKSGKKRVLARLPIVPGYFDSLVADMKDDKDRLRAEGILAGFEFSFMDLTVQREVFSMRIRGLLEKKKPKEARILYNRFIAELETPDNFRKRLNEEKGKLRGEAPDERQKKLIDMMFGQLQQLLNAKTIGDLGLELDREIAHVEGGGTYRPKDSGSELGKLPKNLQQSSKKGS